MMERLRTPKLGHCQLQNASQFHYKVFKPLDIGRIIFPSKGERIYGLVIEAKTKKGVIYGLLKLMKASGAIPRYICFSMPRTRSDSAKVLAFIDLTRSNVSAREALELIRKQLHVKNVELIEPTKSGIVADTYFFPLVIGNKRAIIFQRELYEALFRGIREEFGSAGEALLYYQGVNVGIKFYEECVEISGNENIDDLLDIAEAISATLGLGLIEIVELDQKNGRAKVRIYNSFECELGGNCGKPYSHFFRGLICGFATCLFGEKIKVEETKCIAKGDAYCEFTITTQSKMLKSAAKG